MGDPDSKQNELSYLDPLAKGIGLVVGILYLCGFAIVAGHLSRYGVSSFSVIQLQYLIAGSWALLPFAAAMLLIHVRYKFEAKTAPEVAGRFNWRRFLISMTLSSVPFGALAGLAIAFGGISQMNWLLGIEYYAFFLSIFFTLTLCLNSWRMTRGKENVFFNRDTAPFYLSLCVCFVAFFIIWFTKNAYPLIPYSFGGGRPLTVVFIPGEKKLPDGLKLDQTSKRSVPYKLLTTTDKYYVVLAQENDQLSIELNRDYVAEMIVLAEPKNP